MSSTRLLVLGVVRLLQPVHGYDVRRELLSWRADEWANIAPGSIYSALKTMERDGLIEVVDTDQEGGRPARTRYRLTGEGESEYMMLLRDAWWTVKDPTDPFMTCLNMLYDLPRDEIIAALRHRVSSIEGAAEAIQFKIRSIEAAEGDPRKGDVPHHVAEMMRLVQARYEAEIDWARKFIEKLEGGAFTPYWADPPTP